MAKNRDQEDELPEPAGLDSLPEPAGLDSLAALAAPAGPPKSIVKTLGVMALITILAVAAGGLYGIQIIATVKDGLEARAKAEEPAAASRYSSSASLKDLAPIITNLAQPPETWVRLEASVVLDTKAPPIPDVMMGEISADILAYLRTVTLTQIEGANGLRQLGEDLNERVAIRSEGRVRELIIQTLIVQ
jgi:flagellar protein FliL